MAKIKLEDLEELGNKLAALSREWGLEFDPTRDSKKVRRSLLKARAFDAAYRDGFSTGMAALCQAAAVHAEGRELNGGEHGRIYEHLEKLDLINYLDQEDED